MRVPAREACRLDRNARGEGRSRCNVQPLHDRREPAEAGGERNDANNNLERAARGNAPADEQAHDAGCRHQDQIAGRYVPEIVEAKHALAA